MDYSDKVGDVFKWSNWNSDSTRGRVARGVYGSLSNISVTIAEDF